MCDDFSALAEAFSRDGVVVVRGALPAAAYAEALAAYQWSIDHPSPLASRMPQATDAVFYIDTAHPDCLTGYRRMLEASPLPALITGIWDTPELWFMYEQVFLKTGGESRRTPWHQDTSYLTIAGEDLASAWIPFDPVSKADALEFVRGSHRGTLTMARASTLTTRQLRSGRAPLCRNYPTSRATGTAGTLCRGPRSRAT